MSGPKFDYAREEYYVKPSNAPEGDAGELYFGDDTVVSPGTKLARSADDMVFNVLPTEKPKEDFDCRLQKQVVSGIGPYCGFQQIGIADGYRCLIDKRSKCHADYYDGIEECGPRDAFNCNTWTYIGYGLTFSSSTIPGIFIPGNVEDSFADEELRKGKAPNQDASPCKLNFVLGNSASICCDKAISGKECVEIKKLDETLKECLERAEKSCQCELCDTIEEEDKTEEFQGGNDSKEDESIDPSDSSKVKEQLERQEVTISSYDGAIPVTAGFVPVKGNIIWLGDYKTREKIQESSYSDATDTETTQTVTTEITASFAVALTRAEVGGVAYILSRGKPVYRSAGLEGLALPDAEHFADLFSPSKEGLNAEDINRMTITIYTGERGQKADATMLSLLGNLGAAANRDLVYVVFNDAPLKSFSQSFPDLTFYVYDIAGEEDVALSSAPLLDVGETLVDNFLSQDLDGNVVFAVRKTADGEVKPVKLSNRLSSRVDLSFQQADENSLFLLRDGSVIGHKGTSGRVPMVRWRGLGTHTFYGVNQAGLGHGSGSLGASGRLSGALMKSMPSAFAYDRYSPFEDQRFDVPGAEVITVISQQDDMGVISRFEDTSEVVRNPYTYFGSLESDRANCVQDCIALEVSYCPGNCTTGSTSYHAFNPSWTIFDVDFELNTVLVNTGDETETFELDFVDASGNIFIVGQNDPIGQIITEPGEEIPGCVSQCQLDAELFCTELCSAGVAIIQGVALGRRESPDFDVDETPRLSQGFTAYSVSYPAATEIEVLFFRINAAFSDLITTTTNALPTIGTIPMSFYGSNSSPSIKAVFESQRYDKNWLLVGTSSGDYIIEFDVALGEVTYSQELTVPLPTVMGSGDRRLRWPNHEYFYVGRDGRIGHINLYDGTNSAAGESIVGVPKAQYYDARSGSIVMLLSDSVVRLYPATKQVEDTTVASALAKLYLLSGMTYADFSYDINDPILGVVFEETSNVQQFINEAVALFSRETKDTGALSQQIGDILVVSDLVEENTTAKRSISEPVHKIIVSALKIGTYDTIVTDVARNETDGIDKTYSIKAYLYPEQGRVLAEALLLKINAQRDLVATFVVGPKHLALAPNSRISREGVVYQVRETTLNLPRNEIIAVQYVEQSEAQSYALAPRLDAIVPNLSARVITTPAIDDSDALTVHSGGVVVYAGVVSTDDTIPESQVGFKGVNARIAVSGVDKPLHSGTMTLPPSIQDILTPDRTTILTLVFDRTSSLNVINSVSDLQVINDPWTNLLFVGDELIQFTTVVSKIGNTAQVTGLYRGRNGTHGTLTRSYITRKAVFYILTRDTVFTGTTSAQNIRDYELREVILARQGDQFEQVNARVFNKPYGAMLPPPGGLTHERVLVSNVANTYGWKISWAPSSVFTHKQALEPLLTTPENYALTLWSPFNFNAADYRHNARHMKEVVFGINDDDARKIETFVTTSRSLLLTETYLTSKGFSVNSIYTSLIISVAQIHPVTDIRGIPGFEVFPLSSQRF